ncbi:MAG TPA: alpha/beta hydrolase [Anaerolineales bacterium]
MPRKNGLYYRESIGQASGDKVLVWLHGAGGASEQWPYQLRRISGWRVLTLDLPAHGRSAGEAQRSITAYAEEVGSWLDSLGIQKAVIGGHSMGAAIGLQMALEQSERVGALILLGAGARMPVNPDLLRKLAMPAHEEGTAAQIAHWSYGRGASQAQKASMARMLIANQPGVLAADFQACAAFGVMERLKDVWRPAMVVSGDQDQMMPAHQGKRLAEALPRGSLVEMRNVGHLMMQEAPRELLSHVTDFLNNLDVG